MPKLSPISHVKLRNHMVFTKPGVLRRVAIPKYAAIPVFIIRNNLRTAGITRERYLQIPASARGFSITGELSGRSGKFP